MGNTTGGNRKPVGESDSDYRGMVAQAANNKPGDRKAKQSNARIDAIKRRMARGSAEQQQMSSRNKGE